MSTGASKTGVVLMTYGSATTAEHVREYMERIYKGSASEELITDFERRYRLVGHSPLIEITKNQAALLQKKLGRRYAVESGMRHSEPTIERAVKECKKAGAKRLVGIIFSPQFSFFIMEGYKAAFAKAAQKHGFAADDVVVTEPWPSEPHFIELLVDRINSVQKKMRELYGKQAPVVFTTHSLPQRVVEKDPSYLKQLEATISAVRKHLPRTTQWYAGYQSAGHTPEEWLKPDLTDILEELRGKVPAVLIVPIQFLADHLEILYDLDRAASEQCADAGISYHRIELPNTDPLFIEALAAIARARMRHMARVA